jgi:phospholipid/cholesterol/gamma-HCH transport system ATP-binding protein
LKQQDQESEVSIQNLTKSFGGVTVLKDISFEVARGEIFVIMGPSGSGKSVLLKTVAGLEAAEYGSIRIRGTEIVDPQLPRADIRLAFVFQAGALFNSMTVFENLALYPSEHRLYDKGKIRQKVTEALRILSLEDAAGKFPSELSGGMKKRVAIARALVMEPELILYDEPTSELDPIMGATISEIIANLRNEFGVTSLVVSHDRDLAMTIADRVAILMKGKLLIVDTPEKVKVSQNKAVTDFLNPVIDINHPRFKEASQNQ